MQSNFVLAWLALFLPEEKQTPHLLWVMFEVVNFGVSTYLSFEEYFFKNFPKRKSVQRLAICAMLYQRFFNILQLLKIHWLGLGDNMTSSWLQFYNMGSVICLCALLSRSFEDEMRMASLRSRHHFKKKKRIMPAVGGAPVKGLNDIKNTIAMVKPEEKKAP
jgi:hypothetical protein